MIRVVTIKDSIERQVYLNLFTEETFKVFVDEQKCSESGFPISRKSWAKKLKPGDRLVCYATGEVKKFFGLLEVESESFEKHDQIWEGRFPIRVKVKPLILLEPKDGVPIEPILPELEEYQKLSSKNRWSILVRGSLRKFKGNDMDVITRALRAAKTEADLSLETSKTPCAETAQIEQTISKNCSEGTSQHMSLDNQKEVIKRQIRNLDELKDIIPLKEFKIRLKKLIDTYQHLN